MNFKWLDFKITSRCNNKCAYCGVDHNPPLTKDILTTETIVKTLQDALNAGFNFFALLGGEPSLRNDWDEIVKPFEGTNGIVLMVITNGLIFNEGMYRAVYASGADYASIVYSVDSLKKPNYKNQDPSIIVKYIDRLIDIAKEYCTPQKIRKVEVHTVISRENYNNFSYLVNFFSKKSVDVSLALVCPSFFVNNGKNLPYNVFTYDELDAILNELKDLEKSGKLNFPNTVLMEYLNHYPLGNLDFAETCNAGKEHVIINFDGEVYPCITESYRQGLRYGNIIAERFLEIYRRMENFKCNSKFSPACWDHYLWNKLSEYLKMHVTGRKNE